MLDELKINNFRNIESKVIKNIQKCNTIIWINWQGKTNILESIALLSNNSIGGFQKKDLIKKWESWYFLQYTDTKWNIFSISYDINLNKTLYKINSKIITKSLFAKKSLKTVIFSPIIMNMLYLSPSLRRKYIDDTLKSSTDNYSEYIKKYKYILLNRNKTLKYIAKNIKNKSEILFWNNEFLNICEKIYIERFNFINFIWSSINKANIFIKNNYKLNIKYISNIKQDDIKWSLETELIQNEQKEILLQKTLFWPHLDDLKIYINDTEIEKFLSRWEIKSIIIWLKLIEWLYIEKKTNKKPILLIDDLISELDDKHKELLLKKIQYYQCFITTINDLNIDKKIKI